MKAIIDVIQKKKCSNNFIAQFRDSESYRYKYFKNNGLLLKKENDIVVLKIRLKRKYHFKRIEFKNIKNNIWFGKSPNSKDLILVEQFDNIESYEIYVFTEHWKYRFLILGLIQANTKIDCIYNKLN
jgi:hypothetical protein